uniref:Lipoprotein n=1 Tax=Arundo donax TaxID=35708 RepID=A0A0A8YMB9_ARUDO
MIKGTHQWKILFLSIISCDTQESAVYAEYILDSHYNTSESGYWIILKRGNREGGQ